MKFKTSFITAGCIAAMVFGASFDASAKEKKSASPTPSASPSPMASAKPSRPIPYHGKIVSADTTAKTFTVGKRTFKVMDETKITKQGAAATMADIVAGEEVGGSYWKKEDGSLEAKTVKLGPKSEKAMKEKAAASPSASPAP